MTPKTDPLDERVISTTSRRASALPRRARSAIAAWVILGSCGALACGDDEAGVEDGGNASGGASSGGAEATGDGAVSGAGAGDGPVGGEPGHAPYDYSNPFPECSMGQSSEPCGWALASESTGTACTPGEALQLGCCDCGEDAILRVCDGSMACSASESLGFNDDACQRCPVVQFTCPPSGVFSALTGSYPHFEEDFAVPPSACRPTLIKLSNSAGGGAGTIGFEAIYPILVTHCARCHGEGGLATLLDLPELASSDIEVAFEAARAHADILLAQISSGAMPPDSCTGRPPGSDGCVSAEDFELMRKWFVAGTPR